MSMSIPGNSCRPCSTTGSGCLLTTTQVCYSGAPLNPSGINPGDTVTVVIQKLVNSSLVVTANDGLTASSNLVKLGQTLGQIGDPAKFIESREIPNGGFNLYQTGAGRYIFGSQIDDTVYKVQITGNQAIYGVNDGIQQLIKLPGSQTITNAFYQVVDSLNSTIFEMRSISVDNVYIGTDAGKVCTTGTRNTAIGGSFSGVGCMSSITSGRANVAVGCRALNACTTGIANVSIGDACMLSNITGSNNCAIGQDCLSQGTLLTRNIAIGVNAGKGMAGFSNFTKDVLIGGFAFNQATAGDNNVVIGDLAAGCQFGPAAHGDGNVVIGSQAVANFSMGTNNIVLGYLSHVGNPVGSNVISIGASNIASGNNTTLIGTSMSSTVANIVGLGRSDQNIIIANTVITTDNGAKVQVEAGTGLNQSLLALKTSAAYTNSTPLVVIRNSADLVIMEMRNSVNSGFTSTFLGKNSGTNCTANTNVGVGEDCLALVTSGTSNTAIGFRTLAALTTGTSNIAVGHASQNALTTGARNISAGRTSLLRSLTATDNIIIGDSCMQELSAPTFNVAIGNFAMCSAEGANNIAIGYKAMFFQSSTPSLTRPSTGNIAIGYNASFTVQLGTNNTVLGTSANFAGVLGNGNTLIGANTDSTASITNTTLLGQGITTSVSNISVLCRGDQNAIIGITSPSADNGARIQVAGNKSFGIVVSSAGTLTLDATGSTYVFSGTTGTWSLPAIAGKTGWEYIIKNRGSGILTINVTGATTTIYGTSAVSSYNLNPGEGFMFINDGTFWNVV